MMKLDKHDFRKNSNIFELGIAAALMLMICCGCGMSAHDYYVKGQEEMDKNNCSSDSLFSAASDKELKDEGNWYPIYMMSLGLSRTYCNEDPAALKAFQTVDQFTVRKSDVDGGVKAKEFMSVSSKRMYELSEREETLLHFYMGLNSYRMGSYDDALIELKKVDYIAQGRYSSLPLSAMLRGLIYAKLHDSDNAVIAFRQVIDANPTSPLGYKLALMTETNAQQREDFIRQLKEKTGADYQEPSAGLHATIVLVDVAKNIDPKGKFVISSSSTTDTLLFVDVVDPDFDFGKFMGGVMKEVASGVLRETASRLTFGLSGLFFGSNNRDDRHWDTLPAMFYGDLLYLGDTSGDFSINYVENGKIESDHPAALELVTSSDITVTRFVKE